MVGLKNEQTNQLLRLEENMVVKSYKRRKTKGSFLSRVSLLTIWSVGLTIMLIECVFLEYFWYI